MSFDDTSGGQSVSLQPGQSIRPILSKEYARKIVTSVFGLNVLTIKEYNSYDDRNFHVIVDDKLWDNPYIKHIRPEGYMLKVLNSMDSKKFHYDGEHQAMKILDSNGIECPLPVKNIYGTEAHLQKIHVEENENELNDTALTDESLEGRPYTENIVRLLVFVRGQIIWTVPYVPDLLYGFGKVVGKLQRLLMDFHHPSMKAFHSVWNMEFFPEVAKFVYVIKDENDSKMVLDIIEAFKQEVIPVMDQLQKGVIHGDANEQNTLVRRKQDNPDEYEIVGLLDFGDMSESCYIFEVGMGIMYLMVESKVVDFMEAGGHILAGYMKEMKLSDQEFDLIYLCVAARYATSLAMGAYTYSMDPGNEYAIVTAKNGWPQLRKFWATSKEKVYEKWNKVISSYH